MVAFLPKQQLSPADFSLLPMFLGTHSHAQSHAQNCLGKSGRERTVMDSEEHCLSRRMDPILRLAVYTLGSFPHPCKGQHLAHFWAAFLGTSENMDTQDSLAALEFRSGSALCRQPPFEPSSPKAMGENVAPLL